jgi:hypothetical protein
MTNEQTDRTVVTEAPTVAPAQGATPTPAPAQVTVQTESRRTSSMSTGGAELTRRVVVVIFGLIQLVIGLRFVLLLLDAREANDLVAFILNLSQIFVAPFDGILRTDALHSAGSTFDITAIVAFVGWTILELIIIWAVGIFRRERA